MKNLSTQIATSHEQSKRLLSMGVNPETADMQHYQNAQSKWMLYTNQGEDDSLDWTQYRAPAWSLSRLISMMPEKIIKGRKVGDLFISNTDIAYFSFESDGKLCYLTGFTKGDEENVFDICIDMIDWLIKLHHFNKEYLKGGKP